MLMAKIGGLFMCLLKVSKTLPQRNFKKFTSFSTHLLLIGGRGRKKLLDGLEHCINANLAKDLVKKCGFGAI
jgi:hypothetical protein